MDRIEDSVNAHSVSLLSLEALDLVAEEFGDSLRPEGASTKFTVACYTCAASACHRSNGTFATSTNR